MARYNKGNGCNSCGVFGGGCGCGNKTVIQNTTEVIPVDGESAYEAWKAYYGSQYPDITTEKEWIDAGFGVQGSIFYSQFEI